MMKKELDAVLITRRENYLYLSGFTGTSAFLIITPDDAILVTDFRYVEQAAKQAPEYEVVLYRGSVFNTFNDILKKKNIGKLAFEDSHLSVSVFNEYKKKLTVKQFVPLGKTMEELRVVKDAEELKIIRKAVKIADDAFMHILGYIKPGVMEVEIAAELEYFMKKQGATGASFETIAASGNRSSMPHGVASDKKTAAGDAITLDYGALYNGYCSDMTRTVFLGKPDGELEKIYKTVLASQLKALEGVKAGLSGSEIDSIARSHIEAAGYGDNFGHGLGHGVGLEIHEEPRLSMTSDTIMRDGMVVTVEPGIYVSGLGGVRIEDMVVVRKDDPEILTKSTKEMIIL